MHGEKKRETLFQGNTGEVGGRPTGVRPPKRSGEKTVCLSEKSDLSNGEESLTFCRQAEVEEGVHLRCPGVIRKL